MNLKKIKLKIYNKFKQLGLTNFLLFLCFYPLKKLSNKTVDKVNKIDVFSFYDFILIPPRTQSFTNQDTKISEKTVNWIIPDFHKGSGGHINIFRLIANLEKNGYQCRIVIVGGSKFDSGDSAYQYICQHFNMLKATVSIGEESIPPAWITVATSWITAYTVERFSLTKIKCYFVQDFEPFFYSHSSEYIWAEQTYKFGFYGITAGDWLAEKLKREYGMITKAISFSFDRQLYNLNSQNQNKSQQRQIFFYARSVTPRRGFELGLLTLREVAKKLPDVKFVLAGWDISNYDIPFSYINAGIVPLDQLAELYNQCDVALVLSFTNLSLLPLELMACGCPVVSNKGDNVEWLLNSENAVLVEPTVDALSDALVKLLEDEEKRQKFIQAGLEFVNKTNWETEAQKVSDFFNEIVCDKIS